MHKINTVVVIIDILIASVVFPDAFAYIWGQFTLNIDM